MHTLVGCLSGVYPDPHGKPGEYIYFVENYNNALAALINNSIAVKPLINESDSDLGLFVGQEQIKLELCDIVAFDLCAANAEYQLSDLKPIQVANSSLRRLVDEWHKKHCLGLSIKSTMLQRYAGDIANALSRHAKTIPIFAAWSALSDYAFHESRKWCNHCNLFTERWSGSFRRMVSALAKEIYDCVPKHGSVKDDAKAGVEKGAKEGMENGTKDGAPQKGFIGDTAPVDPKQDIIQEKLNIFF